MYKSFFLILFGLFVQLNGYSQHSDKWLGRYSYFEEPEKALAGYNMVMVWELSVYYEKGQELGMLEINGQQTNLNYIVYFVGDEDSITAYFDEAINHTNAEGLERGDKLFTLTKTATGIITIWEKMTPRLVEVEKKKCDKCFEKSE